MRVRRVGDADVVERMFHALSELGVESATVTVSWAQPGLAPTVVAFDLAGGVNERVQETLALLRKTGGLVSAQVRATNLNNFPGASLILTRGGPFDELEFGFAKVGGTLPVLDERCATLVETVEHAFATLRTGADLAQVIGDDLARYYETRDSELARLEELNTGLIRENHEFRSRLEEDFRKRRETLETEAQTKAQEEEARIRHRVEELEAREKALDDRSATHARRDQYRGLMAKIQGRSKSFKLSKDTEGKRWLMHGLFAVLLGALGLLVVAAWQGTAAASVFEWWAHLKFAAALASFVAGLVYYIRWNDAWFQRNATEEFRLKQYDLDLDRAGWLVELAIEASEQAEPGGATALLERLSRGLFDEDGAASEGVRHPAEDLRSALLEAAGSVEVEVPGLGRVTLGHKEVQRLRKNLAERGAS